MKIAIYVLKYNEKAKSALLTLTNFLENKKVEIHIEHSIYRKVIDLKEFESIKLKLFSYTKLDISFDFLISMGGDGTILRAITQVKDLEIPIVGINTGNLGFLSNIKVDSIESALDKILKREYKISNRCLLSIETDSNQVKFDLDFALNEIAVGRKNTTSMISIKTWLDDEYLTSYWADGLIISTPTGSTGYSLSCGGPVIMPESESLVLTPIAPHNLNARPLVIPAKHKISLEISGRENEFLVSLDSRISSLKNSTTITIKKAPYFVKMIELDGGSFIETLRKKLLWGVDQRN